MFREKKHIALEDLRFYDDEEMCNEMQSWSDSEDWHYIIPFTVISPAEYFDENSPFYEKWIIELSNELIELGATPNEVVFIETNF